MADKSIRNLWGIIAEKKSVPAVAYISEQTRDGINKAYIPKFLYKPPFGYPRFVDLPNVRRLASMPYVEMCISTIVDEASSIPWDIVPIEGKETESTQEHIDHAKSFFRNPNTNKESWEEIRRKYIRDILEIDAGVLNKTFNIGGDMVEIVARDGATFTKNPDIYGMMTERDDIIHDSEIATQNATVIEMGQMSQADARERAAYFQYGWISGARPVPFGRKEIVWFERNPRTDSIYGRSPVEILMETIQTLIYAIEHNLEYFNDNSIPKGIIGLDGGDAAEVEAFKEQWIQQQLKKDTAGNWKKKSHDVPVVGKMPKFERIQFSNAELELLEGQKWWAKLVWACFGVTSVELGYTEDSKGLANQIVQSNVFKKRSINPILRLEEYRINQEIISEFGYDDIEYKYMIFDVEEETKKAQLYNLQLQGGWKSVNEIRVEEGLEEVEWGEKQSAEQMLEMQSKYSGNPDSGTSGSMGKEESSEKEKVAKEKENRTSKKKDSEEKALTTNNPLNMGPNEVMDENRLKRAIVYLFRQNEKKIKELIEKEAGTNKLKEIKSIDGIAKGIQKILSFIGIKAISDAVINVTFMKGWESAEKQTNQNYLMNKDALTFIQDYTFNNIKGMTDEIMLDLRQELERGIMEGNSIAKLKDRVSKVFDVGETRAEAIARTETNRAENQGKLQAFKSSGEKYKKKWLTHEDDRTSPICKRLDGQVVGMNDNFKDSGSGWEGPCPPSHVNCRSSVLYLTDDDK